MYITGYENVQATESETFLANLSRRLIDELIGQLKLEKYRLLDRVWNIFS